MVCVYTAEIDGRQRRLATSHCFHSYMETGTSCCQRILTSLPYVTETRCSLILKNLDVLGAYLGGFIEMSVFNIYHSAPRQAKLSQAYSFYKDFLSKGLVNY